jgi:outer membrane protein assembly factor BamD
MKTMKYFIYSAFLSSAVLLTACASATDPAEAYKGESDQQIYRGGEDALRDKNYGEAIKRYEALDVQYPYGQHAEIAQLHIIYAYYMNSDYLAAEAAADRFVHAHPTNPHVDYAYFMRGLANYYQNMGVFERLFSIDFATRDLSQLKKSFNDFAELVNRFPDSRYAPAAHQYMIYLRNVLANHQLEVAQYYYGRQAYVAAANRASLVVRYYQGAPAIPQALLMMAKAYHQLHQTQLENQTILVLAYNFPNSAYLAEARGDASVKSTVMEVPVQRLSPLPKPVEVKPPVSTRRLE